MKIKIELLKDDLDLHQFDCNNSSINEQVKESLFTTLIKKGYAYKICLDDEVVGYYLISLASVVNYSGTYDPQKLCTAIKLDYLAIAKKYQGKGLGHKIIDYLVRYARDISHSLPVRYFTLDSLSGKERLYASCGFLHHEGGDSLSPTTTMYIDCIDEKAIEKYHSEHI